MSRLLAIILTALVLPRYAPAQTLTAEPDESLYDALEYRCIGPFRGGRAACATGIPDDPMTYYFGASGGGVWRTEDAGQTWENVSDGYFGGSIGAIAVSEWDPNVIYVGGGEVTVRGNVSHGYGMWKSTDRGKTWKQIGLEDSRRIPRIRIHPRDPELVYAAVLGHLFGPNEQRGVYRSADGGETWERVLFVSDEVGAVDLAMDPSNPRILFAGTWRVRRTPYSLESGGEGSGLWKSTNGGDTWTDITRNEGLPEGTIGIVGVSVSPADPDRVFAIIEAEEGGVFLSDDAGETWRRVNEERKLRQRAWYYSRIYADPQSRDTVYVVNVRFWRSQDGGRSFQSIRTPHGDHHDLWIAPEDPRRMIVADDGGGQVSFDGGGRWSTYENQPTAQFYRVTTDNHFPYRVYGAQQDNSTVRTLHRSEGRGISERDWEPTAGGESGWLAPHPEDPEIVYGGSYGGELGRMNHRTRERRAVDVWPDNPMGHGAEGMNPRFQWNFPILFSPHDPNTLYAAGNLLFATTNEGQSWRAISPDLTRNDPAKLGPSGGPITKDNTGVEYYATIFTVTESSLARGVIWAGSDDGLIHVTRNGGEDWVNVTPSADLMPEWIQVNCIEASPFEAGGAHVAATMYKSDDFRPYLYRTVDYGATWEKIVDGIPDEHFTRVIRADPRRRGLLYAGTESGMYVSFDDGARWTSFQLNLPVVPITDLAIKDDDLVVATQGRSFWVLDDLTPLHRLTDEVAESETWLYPPRPTHRLRSRRSEDSRTRGLNPHDGVMIRYYLRDEPGDDEIELEILEEDGTLIESFTSAADDGDDGEDAEPLPAKAGANLFVWDMRYPDAARFEGLILWGGNTQGPRVVPGTYRARLTRGERSQTVSFEILPDPRSSATPEDLRAQLDFLLTVRDELTRTHEAIERIRDVRAQLDALTSRLDDRDGADRIREAAKTIDEKLTAVEETLYQTKNRSPQDPLNYPIRLNDKLGALGGVASRGDFRPTDQAEQVLARLVAEIEAALTDLARVLDFDLPVFNQMVRDLDVPRILVEDTSGS